MNPAPAIANAAWLAGGVGHVWRFHHALSDPAVTQERWLRAALRRHAKSSYGQRFDFASIDSPTAYAKRVPMVHYTDIAAEIDRIACGEADVLAVGRVSHLAPTSGSSGGRKLIPFSDGLSRGFNAAIFPWMANLVRQKPRVFGGPTYWSISPHVAPDAPNETVVPIGFADDADYLGGARAWLVRQALAVPSSVRHVTDVTVFWRLTLLSLLRRRDLRLISIWHPSFIDLIIAAAAEGWPELLEAIASGECLWSTSIPLPSREAFRAAMNPERAAELRRIGHDDWTAWWPELQVVSCWGEQAAEAGWLALRKQLPGVLVQPKGLLATECAVTIPLGSVHVLALTSHYFEFLSEAGDVLGSHELERGRRYEVVVTNGGGLWRYRLGDVVECTGQVHATPTFRFLGRAGRVSDLRGEKLEEVFVAEVLRSLWKEDDRPSWAALRPEPGPDSDTYELLVPNGERPISPDLVQRTEAALCANPHYALARRLGQLKPVRVRPVHDQTELERLKAWHGRIGDAKPCVLLISEPRQVTGGGTS